MMFCKSIVILFVLCVTVSTGIKFRFDYEFSPQAEGWLKLHFVPSIWSEARLRCHAEGAILASPLTRSLREAIVNHVAQQSSIHTIYTGVHATFSKGVYASIEGVPLNRLPITWAPGEPDNYENSESCLAMVTSNNGTMKDVRCNEVFPYVCYKKRVPLVVNGCGTTDPEYNLDVRTGSCYKFHRRGLIWSQAYMTCMAEGGHLAIINNELEARVLSELHTKTLDKLIFSKNRHIASIGFLDWGDGGSWMTIHGETLEDVGFNRWWKNGPDNMTRAPKFSSELCGSIVRSSDASETVNGVNDVACDVELPFICEKKPESLENYDELFR